MRFTNESYCRSATGSPNPATSSLTASVNTLYSIGGAIDPAYYSTSGAWNGSGIAFAGSSLKPADRGLYTLFFQHHTGTIRHLQLSRDGSHSGGSRAEVIATDAKNSTPISVVQYVMYAYLLNATSLVQ